MRALLSVAALSLLAAGCLPTSYTSTAQYDIDRMQKKKELAQRWGTQPDVPAWHTQREQVTQAMGDRVFDKDFNRVFDSVTVALASMGMTVDNMERQSGYIAARGQLLPPDLAKQLRVEEMRAWCTANGYDPSLLESRGSYDFDVEAMVIVYGGRPAPTTLTISLVRQSEKQTKVKLRFNGVYYPKTLAEYYKAVWPGIDKQIFLDKATD